MVPSYIHVHMRESNLQCRSVTIFSFFRYLQSTKKRGTACTIGLAKEMKSIPMPPSNMRCFDIWAISDVTYTSTSIFDPGLQIYTIRKNLEYPRSGRYHDNRISSPLQISAMKMSLLKVLFPYRVNLSI